MFTTSEKIVVAALSTLLPAFGSLAPDTVAVLVIAVPSGVAGSASTTSVKLDAAPAFNPLVVHVSSPPKGAGQVQPAPLARWNVVCGGIVSLTDTVPVV